MPGLASAGLDAMQIPPFPVVRSSGSRPFSYGVWIPPVCCMVIRIPGPACVIRIPWLLDPRSAGCLQLAFDWGSGQKSALHAPASTRALGARLLLVWHSCAQRGGHGRLCLLRPDRCQHAPPDPGAGFDPGLWQDGDRPAHRRGACRVRRIRACGVGTARRLCTKVPSVCVGHTLPRLPSGNEALMNSVLFHFSRSDLRRISGGESVASLAEAPSFLIGMGLRA